MKGFLSFTKNNFTMAINKIKEVIESKGFSELTPSKEMLSELGVKLHSWNRWCEKKSDPTFHQVPIIARYLSCTVEELFPEVSEEDNLKHKHKLLS